LSSHEPQRARPVIVHVIDSLVRGGAETLLVNLLPALAQRYDIILVTLRPDRDVPAEDVACREYHCLGYTGAASLAACAWKLRRIIRSHRPDLVRAQLYLSSVVARLATPREVPLVFSIHNPMSADSYRRNRLALPLEKLTYRKRHALISVSDDALRDFDRWVGVKGRSYVLHNFINPAYLEASSVRDSVGRPIRMVAVGMLKEQKNYFYLIEAFRKLKGREVSLDIYGEGPLRAKLQAEIDRHGLPITLKGKRGDIYKVLPDYDLYVMSSAYEGFGIAPVEAMAIGLPALLSDLPVLREISGGSALFFDPTDPAALVRIVERILAGEVDLKALSEGGIARAASRYQKSDYVEKLGAIYSELMDA
jgi:glycosyltransferase involved in cell wall biosynthesis